MKDLTLGAVFWTSLSICVHAHFHMCKGCILQPGLGRDFKRRTISWMLGQMWPGRGGRCG